jgi:hypothetical protein
VASFSVFDEDLIRNIATRQVERKRGTLDQLLMVKKRVTSQALPEEDSADQESKPYMQYSKSKKTNKEGKLYLPITPVSKPNRVVLTRNEISSS